MKQITIVLPNRPGVIAHVSEITAEAGVNIEEIECCVVGEMGVVQMSVDNYDRAMRALHDAGLQPMSEEVFLVRIDNAPGALAQVARRFADAGIDIRSLRIVRRDPKQAIAAISCSELNKARALVEDLLVV